MWVRLFLMALLLLLTTVVESSVQVQSGGASVQVQRVNQTLDLHAEWLRERCQNDQTVDMETLQPQVNPHEHPSPRVRSVLLEEEAPGAAARLRVEFEDGIPHTTYSNHSNKPTDPTNPTLLIPGKN
jgi:hypothetical protein